MLTRIEQQTMDAIISLSREYRKQNRFVEVQFKYKRPDGEIIENVRLGSIRSVTKSRVKHSIKEGDFNDWEYDVMFIGDDSPYKISEETYNKLLEELK